jgi:large subunit ribosomal protein L18
MNMHGTKDRPRLFVFRSNQHIYAQLVDDDKAKILISASDKDLM